MFCVVAWATRYENYRYSDGKRRPRPKHDVSQSVLGVTAAYGAVVANGSKQTRGRLLTASCWHGRLSAFWALSTWSVAWANYAGRAEVTVRTYDISTYWGYRRLETGRPVQKSSGPSSRPTCGHAVRTVRNTLSCLEPVGRSGRTFRGSGEL